MTRQLRFTLRYEATILFCLCILASLQRPSFANSSKACSYLFQDGLHLKAAICFRNRADKLPPGNKLSRIQKKVKALYLKNASAAFLSAAKKEPNKKKQLYLKELSVKVLARYLKEGLCTNTYNCKLIRQQQLLTKAEIGYASLAMVGGKEEQRATVKILGYRYKKVIKMPPNWAGKLRPGQYDVLVFYYGNFVKKWTLTLNPSESKVLALPSPKTKTKTPPRRHIAVIPRRRQPPTRRTTPKQTNFAPFIIMGIGAVALIGGGLTTVLGLFDNFEAENIIKTKSAEAQTFVDKNKGADPPASLPYELTPNVYRQQALSKTTERDLKYTVGLGLIGAGMIGLGVGAFLSLPPTKQSVSFTPPHNTSTFHTSF